MRHSTRISVTFLLVSLTWIGLTDPLCAALFPQAFPTISLFKGWFFATAAALAIKLELSAEEWRRGEAEARLKDQAVRDPLTGLLNRRAFHSHLEAAVERARRVGGRLGVAFIDLDAFKAANDSFGHAFGDAVLRAVATRLRGLLRSADVAARLGGDEFAVVAEPNNGDSIERLAGRLLAAFHEPIDVEGFSHSITLSVGIAHFPDHGERAEQLLRAADVAMYKAKGKGRNGFAIAGDGPQPMPLGVAPSAVSDSVRSPPSQRREPSQMGVRYCWDRQHASSEGRQKNDVD